MTGHAGRLALRSKTYDLLKRLLGLLFSSKVKIEFTQLEVGVQKVGDQRGGPGKCHDRQLRLFVIPVSQTKIESARPKSGFIPRALL